MSNIALILGAGPNVGTPTAKYFSSKSYKTIIVSRNPSVGAADLAISADFSDPSSIKGIFAEVKEKIGIPNVVIYNPYIGIVNPDPLSVPLEEWSAGLNINFVSAYAAAQEAVAGFRELPKSVLKTFAFTGNMQIHVTVPALMHLGISKRAGAHMIECCVAAYGSEGFRKEDAGPAFHDLDGLAHAEEFFKMATRADQGPWEYTFVSGKGYVDFGGRTAMPDLSSLKTVDSDAEAK